MRQKILVVSHDSKHSDARRDILEKAGFEVAAVTDMTTLLDACKKNTFELILLGYSIPPTEKRRIWLAAKEGACITKSTSILELYAGEGQEVDEVKFSHRQAADAPPDDFLETVKSILGKKHNRRAS